MSVKIPGLIFQETDKHKPGWELSCGFVPGAGYQIICENSKTGHYLKFYIKDKDIQKLADTVRLANRNKEEPGFTLAD